MSLAYPLLFVFPFIMLYAAAMDVLTMRIANTRLDRLGRRILCRRGNRRNACAANARARRRRASRPRRNMLLFQLRLVGGGDAKLLAAAALWVGYEQLIPFLVYVTIFGGVLALVLLAYRCAPADALPLPNWASPPAQPQRGHALRRRDHRRRPRGLPADPAARAPRRLSRDRPRGPICDGG